MKGFIPANRLAAVVFEPVRQVADLMRGFEKPWFVAGGWALDLFLNRQTREHEDIEVAIFRRNQEAIWRHLTGWDLRIVEQGERHPWRGEWLTPPVHEIQAEWSGGGVCCLEILFDEAWADTWRFRRDLAVAHPLADIGMRTADNVPFLVPEIVLLYKAKHGRPVDEADFRATLPALNEGRRQWLRAALETVHPGHAWLASL